jgi:hypothetical protein
MAEDMSELEHGQPVRKAVRRLRGFRASFEEQVRSTSARTGIRYAIDSEKLTASFMGWLEAFEAQKPSQETDKAAYVGFAAGLMLRSLITHNPVRVLGLPEKADSADPAYFWPEGHLYVAYCLNIRGIVLEQEFHTPQTQSEALGDVSTWWTFRENVREDPALAIAFLDLFSGQEPDWSMPALFTSQRYREVTRKSLETFHTPQIED